MSDYDVTIKLESNVKMAEKALEIALEQAATAIGQKASAIAAKNAPVDTGLLKNSITYAVTGHPAAISSYQADNPRKGQKSSGTYSGVQPEEKQKAVYIGTNVEYAERQEMYNRNHKHFLKNAVTQHTDEYKKIVESALEAAKM